MFCDPRTPAMPVARRTIGLLIIGTLCAAILPAPTPATGAEAATGNPTTPQDKLYKELTALLPPPPPPATRPSLESIRKYRRQYADRLGKAIALADEYIKKFPNDKRVDEVRMLRLRQRFRILLELTPPDKQDRKEREKLFAEARKLLDAKEKPGPLLAGEAAFWIMQSDLFDAKLNELPRDQATKKIKDAYLAYVKQHPGHDRAAGMLQELAQHAQMTGDQKAYLGYLRQLAKNFPDDPRGRAAAGVVHRKDQINKPVSFSLTTTDGRTFDTKKMKGKVILVDFWATWCGPCLMEIPKLKSFYQRYHAQGFEIIGINLDEDKKSLENLLAEKNIPWPQHWQGKGWQTTLAQQWGVMAIPMMLLIDRNGVLVSDETPTIYAMLPKLMESKTATKGARGPAPSSRRGS